MKHLFIINPAAGSRDQTAAYTKKIKAACDSRGLDYTIKVSKEPGDCTRLTKAAAQTGEEVRIYACGGDGTVHEVANGIAGFSNAAMSCIPIGTGNDFLNDIGQGKDDALRLEWSRIKDNTTMKMLMVVFLW